MTLTAGQVLKERYRIVELLGEGGFGAVYRAWDIILKGPCAVKESFDTSPAAQSQFSREASMLFNLRHPNLPRVFDSFSIPGQGQYLVMDYIEGEDLDHWMERAGGALNEAQVLPWIIQICDALTFMHAQAPPVIHRDIKPANIRITPQGQAILVDFGIAKLHDPHMKTTAGARAVTPGFSPPEQYGQGATDAQSDVYALGATLYALLTGQMPPDSVDLLAGNATPPAPVRVQNPAISPTLSAVIEHAMQLNKAQRFRSATEFKAALQSVLLAMPLTKNFEQTAAIAPTPSAVPTNHPSPNQAADSQPLQPPAAPALKGKLPWILTAAAVGLLALCIFGFIVLRSASKLSRQTEGQAAELEASQTTLARRETKLAVQASTSIPAPAHTSTTIPTRAKTSIPTPTPAPAGLTLPLQIDFAHPSDPIRDQWNFENDRIKSEFSAGELHWYQKVKDGNYLVWLPPGKSPEYTDFTLETQARFVEGPWAWTYGLIFRVQDEKNFYLFLVGYNGDYIVDKIVKGEWHRLHDWTKSPALDVSQANRLKVICQGDQISVFANDTLLTTVKDNSFNSGSVGIYFQGKLGIHVAFQYIEIGAVP